MAEKYRKPQTIEELKQFCAEKGMPLEKMRFFIGEDYPDPRAFGIYEAEDGDFVVYKNKADGTRAVRYKGPNEAYAVNELYEKLKAETAQRRSAPRRSSSGRSSGRRSGVNGLKASMIVFGFYMAIIIAFLAISGYINAHKPHRGYYRFDDRPYYYYRNDWYGYDDYYDDWYLISDVDPYLEKNYDDYYVSEDYDADYGVSDFEDSDYWTGYDDSYYDSDDDYDWDSGSDWDSWDSGGTDWDSDW